MAGVVSLSALGVGAPALAASRAPVAVAAQKAVPVDARQTLLDAVASLNENLVEFALDGNVAKIAETANAIEAAMPKLRTAVPPATFARIESRVREQRTGVNAGDNISTALASVEMYRLLQEAIDPNSRAVPIQVPLLDYAGFKLLALARSGTVDWSRIDTTVKEANVFWKQVEGRIGSAATRNMVASIMTGLAESFATKNRAYCAFAAKMLLESVDLLEGQFPPR